MPKRAEKALTVKAVENLKPPKSDKIEVPDGVVPGLALRVSHTGPCVSGEKLYHLRSRLMSVLEDRVFGRPESWPTLPLPGGSSTSFDLCSIPVEGAKVVYAHQGTIVHPPLVFVHGWGASHKVWNYTFPAFAPRYRCIAPDLVGFGLSDKPRRDYTVDGYVDWLDRFLDVLKLDRVSLVAHSMGGTIALRYALKRPDRIKRLVVINPLIRGRDSFSLGSLISMAPVIRWFVFLTTRISCLSSWIAGDFSFVQHLEEDLIRDISRGSYGAMLGSLDSLRATDLSEPLESLSVPTLGITTDLDNVVLPHQSELIPSRVIKRVKITGCGHIPMLERPDEFNRALAAWLSLGD